MLGATLSELCSPTFQGRQGALRVHGNPFQPQDKGPGCGGQLGRALTSATSHHPGVRSPALEPGPCLLFAPPRPWRCQQSFLGFRSSRLSPPFLCISSPPAFLCVSVSPTPSVLHLSSLSLGLSVSYSVSSLICVSDSYGGGPFSLCPRDLQWYPSLCVSGCLLFQRGSPEISLVVVGWGRGHTRTASASISHCFCYFLETQPLSCPLPGRTESS